MALKDDLKAVKASLNTEEQFIENFIKGERFVKRYKFYLLAILGFVVLWIVISFTFSKLEESKTRENNILYSDLLLNPSQAGLEELKSANANLYAIYLLNTLEQNKTSAKEALSQISHDAKLSPLLKNIIALNLGEKSIFLKDYEKVLQAYKLLEQNKIREATLLLSQIQSGSSLEQVAKNLKHYQGIQ